MLRLPRHRFVQYADLTGPVRFDGCDDLIRAIGSILHGWNPRQVAPEDAAASPMRIGRTRDGYRRVSARHDTPTRSRAKLRGHLVEALCGFHFELIDWYIDEHPDRLFVHGAAVEIGTGVTLFPALGRVGKSTLTVALAATGCRVHGDDVVPIRIADGHAIGLGIEPRIRPPLPTDASAGLRDFVQSHVGPTYRNRQYVCLGPEQLVPLGAETPIRSIVLLERRADTPATLREVSPADALERIILQNFARELPAGDILDTLHRVVEGARCLALSYGRVEDAAQLLQEDII